MSYRVQYDSDMKWEAEKKPGMGRRLWLTGLFLILFFVLVFRYWEDGAQVLRQVLLPGDAVTTWNSLNQFTWNLYQGVSLPVAAKEFCQNVMQSVY